MIRKNYVCRSCGSEHIVKNGHNGSGSQQYWCKDCNTRGVLDPQHSYTEAQRTTEHARYRTYLRDQSGNVVQLAKKKIKRTQAWSRPWHQLKRKMYLN